MSVNLAEGANDHIPEDFTLDTLKEFMTPAEIAAVNAGEDPLIAPAGPSPEEVAAQAAADKATADAAATALAAQQEAAKPALQIPDTTQAEAAIAKIDTDLEQLKVKFDDGDLTYAEFMAQQRALITQQAQAQVQIERAQAVATDVATQRRTEFFATLDNFKKQGNELLWSDEHKAGWDQALRTVTGNTQYQGLPFEKQIDLAHDLYAANVKAMTGKQIKALPPTVETKKDESLGQRPEPIQTLSGFNGDAAATIDDGEFAAIDRISATDPLEAEARLGRLSAARQQDYLRRVS